MTSRATSISLDDVCRFVEDVHVLVSGKGTLFGGPTKTLPLEELYVFFEVGQSMVIESNEYSRMVRTGINEAPSDFRRRIREHYDGRIEEA